MPFFRKQILAEIVTKKLRTYPACILPSLDIVTPDSIQAVPIISTVVVDYIPLGNQDTYTTEVVSNVGGGRSTASADMSVTYSGTDDDASFNINAIDQPASNGSTASAIGVESSAGDKGTVTKGVVSNVGESRSTASADMSVMYSGQGDASCTTDAATRIDQPASNGSTASTVRVESSANRDNVLDTLTHDQGENWSSPFFFQNEDGDLHCELVVGFRFPSTIKPDTQGGKTFIGRQQASSLIEKIDRSTRINSHFECCVLRSQDNKNVMCIGCKKSRGYSKNDGEAANALNSSAKSKDRVDHGDSDTSDGNVP